MLRSAVPSLPMTLRQLRRAGQLALACTALAVLSACGGGERAEAYKPDRIVAFGDENSAFAPEEIVPGGLIKGLVYSVNVVPVELDDPAKTPALRYCADLSAPASACATSDVESSGAFLPDYHADDDNYPLGAGFYITPGSTAWEPANAVRLLGLGTVTWQPPRAAPTDPLPAQVSRHLKREFTAQYQCAVDVIAIQHIAHIFGKGFSSACPLETRSGATSYAVAGAKIAGLQAQVDQARTEGQLGKGSLVTVWVGQNDIMEIATGSSNDKLAAVKARADELNQIIQQILGTGAKVAVIGVADLGYSPWAATLPNTASTPAEISSLVDDFNLAVRLGNTGAGITTRGRYYTFVDSAELVRALVSNGSYVNKRLCANSADLTASAPAASFPSVRPNGTVATAVGGVFPVQYCTTSTLVTGANLETYLWADEYRPALALHEAIANTALSRVVNQF